MSSSGVDIQEAALAGVEASAAGVNGRLVDGELSQFSGFSTALVRFGGGTESFRDLGNVHIHGGNWTKI
jgi:hypothetical protein